MRRDKISTAYTPNTTKSQGPSAIKKVDKTKMSLGREEKPLDGSAKHLDNGPYTDPEERLAEGSCCFCWNWGHPCKMVTDDGLCRKLHTCVHDDCRTLYHHGHRIRDHVKDNS